MTSLPFEEASDFISSGFGGVHHDVAIVLGSGLSGFTEFLTDKITLRTSDIPSYPRSTVSGHTGEIISATLGRKRILVFSGRVHYYEGGSAVEASVTAIVSHRLGVKQIVLTNAAGILNKSFAPGDLMLIRDHINLTFKNVLIDLKISPANSTFIYDSDLERIALKAASEVGIALISGVYVGLTGPSYETPAEVKVSRILGGDAVGMSTIHEAIFASSVGMKVLGISCLTNYSTGLTSEKLSHSEVIDIGAKANEKFSKLLITFMKLS